MLEWTKLRVIGNIEWMKNLKLRNSRIQIPELLILRKLTISNSLNRNTKMGNKLKN